MKTLTPEKKERDKSLSSGGGSAGDGSWEKGSLQLERGKGRGNCLDGMLCTYKQALKLI